MSDAQVIRIKPQFYIHVLDNSTNVTRVVVGPATFTRQEQERVVSGPSSMIMVPPRHYCIIQNPVVFDDKKPVFNKDGQVVIRHGDEEVRHHGDPFPLYPGEALFGKVSPLQVVTQNTALRLRATRDVKIEGQGSFSAGDEWLFRGPATYIPSVEVQVTELVKASVLKPLQALKLRAKKDFIRKGVKLTTGQEYLEKEPGAYLPEVTEDVVEIINATILTDKKALHLRAKESFKDQFGNHRLAGEEWLVTIKEVEYYIPDVQETVVGEIPITVLNNRQYCVILDPWNKETKKPLLGGRELRVGELSFFLRPGERLESGLQKVHVLESDEALLLRAREKFTDKSSQKPEKSDVNRTPGDRWMIYGPCDYVPPVTVEILEKRKLIPLDVNEGIYVRDVKTGKVRDVVGESYMLKSDEEKWDKDLPSVVEEVLAAALSQTKAVARSRSSVVTYKAPHNTAVQIYDYKSKKPRVVFGPELVMLGPDEQFTVLSLSGDKPKKPHVIKALALQLGPDFMTDIVIVETADHARLSLKLSYNWHFEASKETPEKIFSVPDFVGDACKAIASRVRGEVALHNFDEFHRNSAKIIRIAVFGVDENKKVKNRFLFSANNLVISNIDIQSVEPVDSRTRDALQKSVQLAIEITTQSQEATARHEAARSEQEAKGELERQKIVDEAKAEEARKSLLELQASSAAVEAMGAASAEARAQAARAEIQGLSAVEQATLSAEADTVLAKSELEEIKASQEAEISHKKALDDLEVSRARDLANIESGKFKRIVNTIGRDTLRSISVAGPDMQEKLLGGLGLKSFAISGPESPLNMFGGH
jgi:major vault protein